MLKIQNLNAFYGDVQVLWDVCLEVKDGEVVVLLGNNAAGKTTTISCISRLLTSFTGEIEYDGKRIDGLAPEDVVQLGIVQIPEGRHLFPKLTVRENLEIGSYNLRSRPNKKDNLEKVYSLLPRLKEREKQMAGSLSGGEAQMCAIGRGLMAQPRFLILDEPSLGLAPIIVQDVMKLIREIAADNTTILLVEQNVKQSLKLADRAYILENGKILMEGTGEEMLSSKDVQRSYLGI